MGATRWYLRRRLAHEFGHLLLEHRDRFYVDLSANPRDGDPPEYQPRHERDANEFAANLLPAALVRAGLSKTPNPLTLASTLGVSDLAMRYRLAGLGFR